MADVKITFLGAAGTVTGSRFLVSTQNSSVLVDCGMFQGDRETEALNRSAPAIETSNLSAVVLTRGRQLIEGADKVKIHGDWVNVAAHIANVESFSVHADGDELIQWLKTINKPTHLYLVHGEPESQATFKSRLVKELGWDVVIPISGESFTL